MGRGVLHVLSTHYDVKTKYCFPSVPTIARQSGATDRAVQKYLRKLTGTGVIEIRESKNASSLYTLHFDRDPRTIDIES